MAMAKIPKDHLMERTRQALVEAMSLSKERSRIFPVVVYDTGEGSRSFPREFDDFVATIQNADMVASHQRLVATMGSPFFILGLTMSEIADCPQRMATERETWNNTVLTMLQSIRPWCVVFVDRLTAGILGIANAEPRTPAITAIGLHTAKIVGLAAVCVPDPAKGLEFLPVVEVEDGVVRALGAERYRRIYGPGVS